MKDIFNRLTIVKDNKKEEKDMFGFKTGNKKEKLRDKIDDFTLEYEDELVLGVLALNAVVVGAYTCYQIGKAIGATDTLDTLDNQGI